MKRGNFVVGILLLLAVSGFVDGKEHKAKKVLKRDSEKVERQFKGKPLHNERELVGSVRDIQFLNGGSTIFVLTSTRKLYRSNDNGKTFSEQNEFLEGSDVEQKHGRGAGVYSIHACPTDPHRLVIVGVGNRHWVTLDAGKTYSVMNTTADIREIQFHPVNPDWFLFSEKLPKCYDEKFEGPACSLYLHFTKDFGKSSEFLSNHVVQFGWGLRSDPDETVFMTKYLTTQIPMNLDVWDPKVSFVRSNALTKEESVVVRHGNSFSINGQFVFVAVVVPVDGKNAVRLRVSSNGGERFDEVRVPAEMEQFGYSIVDASHGTAFLHVNHGTFNSRYGTLYLSDATGANYTISLRDHARNQGGQTDFQKVESLEGIYIANQVQTDPHGKLELGDDSEVIVKSFITFDMGAEWRPLKAPKVGHDGKPIECDANAEEGDGCRLHLNGITNEHRFGPFYSTPSAIGIIVATGNVGEHLAHEKDEMSTWISRDAGLTWSEAVPGSFIYDIGDHGSILVLASNHHATNYVLYSVDEGRTWHRHRFREEPIYVTNIVNNPNSTSKNFLVYGQTAKQHGILVHIDFDGLNMRECAGADTAGQMADSDYEKWMPQQYVDSKDDKKTSCLMGRQVTYVRRKQDKACWNGEAYERRNFIENCECTMADYECDYGYERKGELCVVANEFLVHKTKPDECPAGKTYEISSGYRLIGGDTCKGGENRRPEVYPCTGFVFGTVSHHGFSVLVFFCIILAVLGCVTAYSRVDRCRMLVDDVLSRMPWSIKQWKYEGLGGGAGDTLLDDDEFDLDLGVIDDDMDSVLASAPAPGVGAHGFGGLDGGADDVPVIDGPPGEGDGNNDDDDDDFNPRG